MKDAMDKREFLNYIEAQLIPDLRDAGLTATAQDISTLLDIAFHYYDESMKLTLAQQSAKGAV